MKSHGKARARRVTGILGILVCICSMTSCEDGPWPATSLHPFYTESTVIADDRLLGTWTTEISLAEGDPDATAGDAISISRDPYSLSGPVYMLRDLGEEAPPADLMRVVRLGKFLFLDMTSEGRDDISLPVHWLFRVWIEDDTFRMAVLDAQWVEKRISAGDLPLAYERVSPDGNEGIILTASTQDLQAFCIAHAENTEAFRLLFQARRVADPSE